MKKFLLNKSLTWKITSLLVCLLIFPTALLGTFFYQSYKNSLYADADRELENLLQMQSAAVETNLNHAREALENINYGQDLIYFLDGHNEPSAREFEIFLQNVKDDWLKLNSTYPELFLRLKIYTSGRLPKNPEQSNIFFEPLNESKNFSFGAINFVESSTETRQLQLKQRIQILPVRYAVKNVADEKIIGAVEIDTVLQTLIGAKILQKNSQVIWLIKNSADEIIWQSANLNSEKYRRVGTELADGQIKIFCLREEAAIAQAANDMMTQIVLTAALGFLLVVALIYQIVRKTLRRLTELDVAMGMVGTGNFKIHFPEDGYEDEISRMKRRFQQMTEKLSQVVAAMLAEEKSRKDAEFKALQAQINPHFLFNVLESLRMQCEIDRYYKIGELLSALGNLMRYSLRRDGYSVTFAAEWEYLKNYLALMKFRFDDELEIELSCDEKLFPLRVPKMFLQPVVENSFRHGFKNISGVRYLKIRAEKKSFGMLIKIEDNGTGVDEKILPSLQKSLRQRIEISNPARERNSIGLINVLQRLDKICGDGCDIRLENKSGGGVSIEIKIFVSEG